MVFNSPIVLVLICILVLWTTVLTVLLVRLKFHYDRLLRGSSVDSLSGALEHILRSQEKLTRVSESMAGQVHRLETDTKFCLQRIGIERFNPFSDTGGSQSYTVALLDGNANGILMTSLYARGGNRWYIKQVKDGRGADLDLSKEEEAAIGKAKQSH
jgi:hypothetical protein